MKIDEYKELMETIKKMSKDERREALALINGMLLGKKLSQSVPEKTA